VARKPRPKATTAKRFAVSWHPITGTRALVQLQGLGDEMPIPTGALVKVPVPGDVEQVDVDAFVEKVKGAGAEAVKPERMPRAAVLTKEAEHTRPRGVREVIGDMVANANTLDRTALKEVVEQTLARQGL